MPKLQISHPVSYGCSFTTSGAIQYGDPSIMMKDNNNKNNNKKKKKKRTYQVTTSSQGITHSKIYKERRKKERKKEKHIPVILISAFMLMRMLANLTSL